MTHEQWTEVDEYFTELLVPNDPALEQALRNNAAWNLPAHDVSALQGKYTEMGDLLESEQTRIMQVLACLLPATLSNAHVHAQCGVHARMGCCLQALDSASRPV